MFGTGSGSLMLLGVVLGGVVRLLRTDKFNSVLAKLGMKPVPRWSLPWLAIGIGAAAEAAQSLTQGAPIGSALTSAIDGVFAGAFAIAGHETLARTPARRAEHEGSAETTLPPAPPTSME